MIKRPNTNAQRLKRHKRVRGKISGTPEMPRLNVFRSEANIYAQVIDDVNGVTLASASSLDKAIEGYGGNVAAATAVGKLVAERAKAKGIETVTAEALLEKGILSKCEYGFKVLGNGKVSKKVTVKASAFSASAKEAIEAAGGKAEVM